MKYTYNPYKPNISSVGNRATENNYIERYLYNIDKSYAYNYYTGKGGLSGESFADHANFAAYTAAKKEYEQGQFFTPPPVCELVMEGIKILPSDMVIDPTCGRGDFFNFCPNEENCTGVELDAAAARIAAYLYEKAAIKNVSFLDFSTENLFDVALCNPPFNLRWDWKGQVKNSQEVMMLRLAEILKPSAVVALIVPGSWLDDSLYYGNVIRELGELYAYIGGYQLPKDSFDIYGVDIDIKVLYFQRLGAGIKAILYNGTSDMRTAKKAITEANSLRIARAGITAQEIFKFKTEYKNSGFCFKVAKMLFELQTHAHTQKYYSRALEWVEKFRDQVKPGGMSEKEWEATKITEGKVLSYIKKYFKAAELERVGAKEKQLQQISAKRQRKKERGYALSRLTWEQVEICPTLAQYCTEFSFVGGKGTECHFTDLQSYDLNRILQKPYALLNWEQGGGKTGVGHAWSNYLLTKKLVTKAVVLSTALSIKSTWKDHLTRNKESFKIVEKWEDLWAEVDYLLISFSMLAKLKKWEYSFVDKVVKLPQLDETTGKMRKSIAFEEKRAQGQFHRKIYKGFAELVKMNNGRVSIVIDESDEMTSPTTTKTRYAFAAFKHCRYKLEMTGTTTRNNIAELYSQLNFLYNNSPAFLNTCELMYEQNKDGEVEGFDAGDKYGKPYSYRNGATDFRRCFNPARATVLGIEKQNQDVYNSEELLKIIESTIITRTFNEIAGAGKYNFKSNTIEQSLREAALYEQIFAEVQELIRIFGYETGTARKDAALKLQYQMRMLIDACSVPHKFPEFGGGYGEKVGEIVKFCCGQTTPILLGCLTMAGVDVYKKELARVGKEVFVITGETPFEARKSICAKFQKTHNAVLVCTQQSLKSSINIPECNDVVVESLPWNLPKLSQFFFRCIRFDSEKPTTVHFFLMRGSIEENLMALLMDKQRLNEFVRRGELKGADELFDEMEIGVIKRAIEKTRDADDKVKLSWGKSKNDGAAAAAREKKEGFVPFFRIKNKAGQPVEGMALWSCVDTKKLAIGFCNEKGRVVKTVLFAPEQLEQSSPLAFKRFVDKLKMK